MISIHAPPRGATGTGRITSLTRMYFNSRPSARGDVLSRGFTKSMIISIHAPPRGATGHLPSRIPRRFYFNSRPSARGDARWITIKKTRRNFNSRPSARGDHALTEHEGLFFISIHAPPRGASRRRASSCSGGVFQFTPLREGRRKHRPQHSDERDISIHAPPRGATFCFSGMVSPLYYFNSRPSARGDARLRVCSAAQSDFNSRPSARGDNARDVVVCFKLISIHAPPRGATPKFRALYVRVFISIHAPPRGATAWRCASLQPSSFQFTPLREGRHPRVAKHPRLVSISIHAPPRGATTPRQRPTLHLSVFQFTPLREGRRIEDGKYNYEGDFNSRPSARGDRFLRQQEACHAQFQFTPLREGRLHNISSRFLPSYFNSRPSARGDGQAGKQVMALKISIHAPPRGATADAALRGGRLSDFNSRPSARGDEKRFDRYNNIHHFNSRPSARGDIAPKQPPRG